MSGKVKMVTMRDVAQASGFSPATVSIVLNNAPLARYIAPATKKRIEDAARKLGYRPNAMARFLRSRRVERQGNSLREWMTGSDHAHWLTLLGLGPLQPQRP